MEDYDKNKEPSCIKYWDVNNIYGWAMPQRLLLGGSKWVEETSQFNEDFKKSYNDDSDEGYFLETDVQYPGNVNNLRNDLPFLPQRMKTKNVEKFVAKLSR